MKQVTIPAPEGPLVLSVKLVWCPTWKRPNKILAYKIKLDLSWSRDIGLNPQNSGDYSYYTFLNQMIFNDDNYIFLNQLTIPSYVLKYNENS